MDDCHPFRMDHGKEVPLKIYENTAKEIFELTMTFDSKQNRKSQKRQMSSWGAWFGNFVFMFIAAQSTLQGAETLRLEYLDGKVISGTLISINSDRVIIDQGDAKQIEVDSSLIKSLSFANPLEKNVRPLEMTLIDGTRLRGDSLVGRGNDWKWQTVQGVQLQGFAPKIFQVLQLKPIGPQQKQAWADAISDPSQNDGLIVTRPTGELTRVGGTILEAKSGQLIFEFDDQKIEMSIERLTGATWYQANTSRLKKGVELQTIDHSVWNCTRLQSVEQGLEGVTATGLKVTIPLGLVTEIRYGASNVRWLAEIEAIESKSLASDDWQFSLEASKKVFLPRFLSASKTMNSVSDQDLVFSRPGTYTFRMPEEFKRLEARVQRYVDGETRSPLMIEVWQDDEKVVAIPLGIKSEYVDVKADLSSEKKIKLIVRSENGSNVGTEVSWKQPRVLK